MQNRNQGIIGIIDKLIYFFLIIFLCSLTNSIFLNQVGYYLSLILIVVRFYLNRENLFYKTNLEYSLLFYIAAEILSTLFSSEPGLSFHNLLKRFLLIPIIYTFIISAHDFERTKKIVIIYLGAAVITMIVYIGLSYNYFINSFYQLYESGPSTFQYPITSSELMSFSLIFLFAFLIYEKASKSFKILLALLFVINLIALLATYKRTGWIGAAAGILLVIVLSRKWVLLVPVVLVLVAGAFIEKDISNIKIYNYEKSSGKPSIELETKGRAYKILPENESYFVGDFENGLVKYKDNKIVDKYNLGLPVIDFLKWRDSFYVANLIDTRFVLLKMSTNGRLKKVDEFLTSGFLNNWKISNRFVYAIDGDSGLTVFRNPHNLNDRIRYKNITGNVKIFADSNHVIMFSKSKVLSIFSLKNYLPDKLIITKTFSSQSDLIFFDNSKFLINDKEGLKLYSIESGDIVFKDVKNKISNAFMATESENKLFIATAEKKLSEIEYPIGDKLVIKSTTNLDFVPTSIAYEKENLFISQVKRNRMLSIIDPYLPSNFSRIALWRAGLLIFSDHPIAGIGDIDLAPLYKQYKRNSDKEIQGHMHNNYVHLLVTLGIFGFIAAMFLLLKIFMIHIKNYFILKDEPFAASYALGAAGSFFAFLISGLTEWNFGDHEIITMIWFMLSISIAFVKYREPKTI